MEGFIGDTGHLERHFRNFSDFEMKVSNRIMGVVREQVELSWKKLGISFLLTPICGKPHLQEGVGWVAVG